MSASNSGLGRRMQKTNSPLPSSRLFSGEGWKPLNIEAVRQMCSGIKVDNPWRFITVASSRYYSEEPMPISDVGPDRPLLSGTTRGKSVTIIGYFGQISGRHYWVSRCLCGCFELLSEKTLVKKPYSPNHLCPYCSVAEANRYLEECLEIAVSNGLDFNELRSRYKELKNISGASKRHGFGLIHFIKKAAKEKRKQSQLLQINS